MKRTRLTRFICLFVCTFCLFPMTSCDKEDSPQMQPIINQNAGLMTFQYAPENCPGHAYATVSTSINGIVGIKRMCIHCGLMEDHGNSFEQTQNPNYFKFDFELNEEKNAYTVKHILPSPDQTETLRIPDMVDDLPVTTIANDAFELLDPTVKQIELGAFIDAFPSRSLARHSSIEAFLVNEKNEHFQAIDGVLYSKDGTVLVKYPPKKVQASFVVPENVKAISPYAFSGCQLEEISIFSGVESIAEYSFVDSYVKKITFGENLTTIKEYAFAGCTELEELLLPNSLKTIEQFAFKRCAKITSLVIPDSVTFIGESIFCGCTSLKELTLPFLGKTLTSDTSNATTLFGNLFGTEYHSDCTSIRQFGSLYAERYIPNSLKKVTVNSGPINLSSFSECRMLEVIHLGEEVTYIGKNAFYRCDGLKELFIGDKVTHLDAEAFNFVTPNIQIVTIGKGITKIGKETFERCNDLKSVLWDQNVTTIEERAFYDCTVLSEIPLDTVELIGEHAFYSCSALSNLQLLNVKRIETYAFANCNSIGAIIFGKDLSYIGKSAFWNCPNLSIVYYMGTESEWKQIEIEQSGNHQLTNAIFYFYSAEEPLQSGNYWRYVDGIPEPW